MDDAIEKLDKALKNISFHIDDDSNKKGDGSTSKLEDIIVSEVRSDSENYDTAARRIEVERLAIFNRMIEELVDHCSKENHNKNIYRNYVLIVFAIVIVLVIVAMFFLLFMFLKDGCDRNEVVVAKYLILGIFGNLIGLATLIFKYFFDGKYSLLNLLTVLANKSLEFEQNVYKKHKDK